MTEDEAGEYARAYAEAVAAVIGGDAAESETRVSPAPCENSRGEPAGDGRFYVQGNWQMPLPAAEHPGTLERLREMWEAEGYQIKRFQMFNEVEGVIIAENPSDQVEVIVESTMPPTALAVVVMTPCYQPAQPGQPG
ncbi:hypothetical protein Rhe02_53840 [Rhizocola hellebori]|uniref:Uncharacterized protein n=1 Tax=Rhizocola hellebori TaxID=1392758 RepID=A0A8J3VIE9_9ACTN|nr:hypothetical protein [Rhizocola hellebori]GIH07317.1 hypothetical protein Rhe02_53840 [Rhizocola hellebori]